MAGDWIPMSTDLKTRKEVQAIARRTGRSRWEVVGLLHDLWCWVSRECPDGVLILSHLEGDKKGTAVAADDLVDVIGADRVFWLAVAAEHWLEFETAEGRPAIVVPNFDRWMSKGAKARLKDREKKRDKRATAGVSRPNSVPEMSPPEGDKKGTTGEERRVEEDNTRPPRARVGGEDPGPWWQVREEVFDGVRAAVAVRLPPEACLDPTLNQDAVDLGWPPEEVGTLFAKFRDVMPNAKPATDWRARWRRFVRDEPRFDRAGRLEAPAERPGPKPPRPKSAAELKREEDARAAGAR